MVLFVLLFFLSNFPFIFALVRTVVVTSCYLKKEGAVSSEANPPSSIDIVLSTLEEAPRSKSSSTSSTPPQKHVFTLDVAKVPMYYSGTGDLTASLMLAWMHILSRGPSGQESSEKLSHSNICKVALENWLLSHPLTREITSSHFFFFFFSISSVQAVVRKTAAVYLKCVSNNGNFWSWTFDF